MSNGVFEYGNLAKPTDVDRELLGSLLSTVSFPWKTGTTSVQPGQAP